MDTDSTTELQEHGTAGTDGIESKQERTFTADEVTEIVRRRLDKQQRKFDREKEELRETIKANVERAQHLEHDSRQVDKHREELEELRAYKASRERRDMLERVSEEFGGVPVELLVGETEEEVCACAGKIRAYADTFKPQAPRTGAAGATPLPDSIASLYDTTKNRRERIERIAERHAMHG